ncbi:MAG: drug/metabolite transporter (DMT)-like permease [Paracoccaceae bacterium]|jgi:drug/metabolite transporter (DMT)-like permease
MQAQPIKAALWMMGAVVSFTSMAVAGREVAHELDTFEIMAYRSLLGVVVVLLVGKWAGTLSQVSTQNMGLHLLRNSSHFVGQNLWFYALTVITLPQLFAFEFSVPLWVALFAPFFLSEKLTPIRLGSALIGFAGILIVARPDQIGFSPGIIAAALCALFFAGSAISTKLLTYNHSTTCILFWLTVIQAVLGLAFAGFDGDFALPSAQTLPWVILVGFAGLFAHFCITSALQIAPAVFVFPMDFVRLPLAASIGIFYYDEPLVIAVFVGAAIILAANFVNIWSEHKQTT